MRKTYADRTELRVQMMEPLQALAAAHQKLGDLESSIQCLLELDDCFDDTLRSLFGSVTIYLAVAEMMRLTGHPEHEKYRRLAVHWIQTRSGIDGDLLENIFATGGTLP